MTWVVDDYRERKFLMKRNVRGERKGNINTYTLKHTYTLMGK